MGLKRVGPPSNSISGGSRKNNVSTEAPIGYFSGVWLAVRAARPLSYDFEGRDEARLQRSRRGVHQRERWGPGAAVTKGAPRELGIRKGVLFIADDEIAGIGVRLAKKKRRRLRPKRQPGRLALDRFLNGSTRTAAARGCGYGSGSKARVSHQAARSHARLMAHTSSQK
jgi:hypothetical protein